MKLKQNVFEKLLELTVKLMEHILRWGSGRALGWGTGSGACQVGLLELTNTKGPWVLAVDTQIPDRGSKWPRLGDTVVGSPP